MAKFLKKLLKPKQVALENRILSLADESKEFLLPQDLENIRNDIEYNEFGIAFETFCTQLFEYEAPISLAIYTKIDNIGRDIGLNQKTWNVLKPLIKND